MLNTIVGLDISYFIGTELAMSGNTLGAANTKYISDGAHTLSLPPVEGVGAVPLNTSIILEQTVGIGVIEDNVSQVGDDDSGDNLASINVAEGTTVGVILVIAYGRLQWMLIPSILVNAGGSPSAPATTNVVEVVNSGVNSVDTGVYVQAVISSGEFKRADSVNSEFDEYIGVHIGPLSDIGDPLTIVTQGPVIAKVGSATSIRVGVPLRISAGSGVLQRRYAGEQSAHVVGYMIEAIDASTAWVSLVKPFKPRTWTEKIICQGTVTNLSSNVFQDIALGGKHYHRGSTGYLMWPRAKFKTAATSAVDLDIYRNNEVTNIYGSYLRPGLTDDTYGSVPFNGDLEEDMLFNDGDEIRITHVLGPIDGVDLTVELTFEEFLSHSMKAEW